MLAALARRIARHPGRVALAWLLLAGLGFAAAWGAFGPGLFERLTSGEPVVPGESQDGRELLAALSEYGPGLSLVLDGVDRRDVADPALRPALQAARRGLLEVSGVGRVSDPLPAVDGRGLLVSVELVRDLPADQTKATLAAVHDRLDELGDRVERSVPGSQAQVGGVDPLIEAVTEQVEVDLRTGEGIALPVSLLVMVVVFGGFLAAGMPILGAIASIAGALASLLGFSYLIDLDASVVNVVTVMGLGLCIDYGLLMVSRFREELRRRTAVPDALVATMTTAGRTVVFSAVTVAISLAGLLLFSAEILRAIGAAGVSVVVVALLVALTLVPALLALAGPRLLRRGRRAARRFGDIAPEHGVFSRLATRTQRHPVLVALGVVAVLLIAATPALDMRLRSSGPELLPPGHPDRVFFETLDERFPAATFSEVQVVGRTAPARMQPLADRLAAVPGVAAVTPPQPLGDGYAVVSVRTEDQDAGGAAARAVVEEARSDRPAYPMWVTGPAASLVDFTASVRERAPWAVALVVLATFVLLFLMTGSVLVPAKALVMNVVSLGASFGVLVWVFQQGHLEGLLGFESAGGIETTIPPLVLAFGFGLAMDYEVFLLSRVKELRDAGLSNDAAVVAGLQRSGRIITSAALIIVLVFSGFVFGELLIIKQTGIALAVAVAVDTTLIRCLLVPATMTLLGEWNWWAPAPLRRLHRRFQLAEPPEVSSAARLG